MSDDRIQSAIRAQWESARDEMIAWLQKPIHGVSKKKAFTPKAAEKCVDVFIDNMAFARIPRIVAPVVQRKEQAGPNGEVARSIRAGGVGILHSGKAGT